jgi:hypothetical protein
MIHLSLARITFDRDYFYFYKYIWYTYNALRIFIYNMHAQLGIINYYPISKCDYVFREIFYTNFFSFALSKKKRVGNYLILYKS